MDNYLIGGLLILFGLSMYTETGNNLVNEEIAKKMIKDGAKVIDIRSKFEYDVGHYKNAIHIPIDELNEESTKKLDKNEVYIVYCNTGQRARKASEMMKKMGFKNVFYISGTYYTLIDKNNKDNKDKN